MTACSKLWNKESWDVIITFTASCDAEVFDPKLIIVCCWGNPGVVSFFYNSCLIKYVIYIKHANYRI